MTTPEKRWTIRIYFRRREYPLLLEGLDTGAANRIHELIQGKNASFANFSWQGADYAVNRDDVAYLSKSPWTPPATSKLPPQQTR